MRTFEKTPNKRLLDAVLADELYRGKHGFNREQARLHKEAREEKARRKRFGEMRTDAGEIRSPRQAAPQQARSIFGTPRPNKKNPYNIFR